MIGTVPVDSHEHLRILTCTDGIIVAEVGPVCVVIWRGDVTEERFELQSTGLAEVAARHSPNAALLCIVEPTVKPPSRRLRKASIDMLNSHVTELRCVAGVCEGEGILTSIGRVVMTGMAVVFGRPKIPLTILGSVEEAALWMHKHISLGPLAIFAFLVEVARTNLDVQDLRASVSRQKVAIQGK